MLDLGVLDGPVLIFGGPYSNDHATRALREAALDLDIPPERSICTGDVVAYGARPQKTVDLIRNWGVAVVQGNCEESIGEDLDDCGCGFENGSACDTLSGQWFSFARNQIDAASRSWMRHLPKTISFRLNGASISVVHGAPSHISRFIFASTADADLAGEMDRLSSDVIIGGHCGLPFHRTLHDGRLWINAGVIGMPANDGTSRVWYAVLHPQDDGIRVTHKALTYDHATAAADMRAHALPEAYAACLENGLWPSMDILPDSDRQARGRPLVEQAYTWRPVRHTP